MNAKNVVRTSIPKTTALVLGLMPQLVMASAWTRNDGEVLILLPTSYTYADKSFDGNGNRVNRNKFEMAEFSPLIEYGVSDSFTIGMQPKVRTVWMEAEDGSTESNSGLAESEFFVRQRLWHRDQASLALQAGAKVPINPQENSAVPIGRNQVDADVQLAYGNVHSTGIGRIFYSGEVGYTKRWEIPADEASYNAFIGWSPRSSSWSFILRSANTVSVGNHGTGDTEVLTAFPEYKRHDIQLMTSYQFSNSVSLAGGISTTYAGENVGIGNTGFVALSIPYMF